MQYSKGYDGNKCTRLVIDSTETNCYYATRNLELGVANVNCTDGAIISYYETTSYDPQYSRFSMSISPSGNTIVMVGSVRNLSNQDLSICRYSVFLGNKIE